MFSVSIFEGPLPGKQLDGFLIVHRTITMKPLACLIFSVMGLLLNNNFEPAVTETSLNDITITIDASTILNLMKSINSYCVF